VGKIDGQNLNVIDGLLFGDNVFERVIKNHFAEFDFDLHFPNAGNAQKNLVGGIFEFFGNSRR
jgi:hypothetical protein